MGKSLKRIMIQIPEKFLKEFDKEIQGLYASRNEAIRAGMLLVLEYLRQTAVICPYATIKFTEPTGEEHLWQRISKKLPPIPCPMPPHPKGIDYERLRRMIESGDYNAISELMTKGFQKIGYKTATNILYLTKRFGEEILPETDVSRLSDGQIHQIVAAVGQ